MCGFRGLTHIAKFAFRSNMLFPLSEWADEQIAPNNSVNILRLIYQGRFLHGNVTLGGKSTVLC